MLVTFSNIVLLVNLISSIQNLGKVSCLLLHEIERINFIILDYAWSYQGSPLKLAFLFCDPLRSWFS
jgi:hypothetical protein